MLSRLGSANRDETVFDRPDEFDIARRDDRQLAYGFGLHYCLGASLAAMEAQVALRVILARTRSIRRVDDAPLPLHPSFVFRAVRWSPRRVVGPESRVRLSRPRHSARGPRRLRV